MEDLCKGLKRRGGLTARGEITFDSSAKSGFDGVGVGAIRRCKDIYVEFR